MITQSGLTNISDIGEWNSDC